MVAGRRAIEVLSTHITAASLLACLALLVPVSGASAAAPPCSEVLLVFARGSGQDASSREMHAFFGAVRGHTPAGLRIGEYRLGLDGPYKKHKYPARGAFTVAVPSLRGSQYDDSVIRGINELTALLNDRVKCPGELWILGGYSQGAQVVGQTVRKLTAAQRERVGFVALFGDPLLRTDDNATCSDGVGWWLRGTVECGQGGILGRRHPYFAAALRGRAGSWCDKRDGICASGLLHVADGSHKQYPDAMIGEAALEAVVAVHTRGPLSFPVQSLDISRGSAGADMMVVFDTTGSMEDEIDDARANAAAIASTILARPNGRVGLVQFRDHDDDFVSRLEVQLTSDLATFQAGLDRLEAEGGGDTPEAQYSGIMTALNEATWRFGATKMLVVITDAAGKDPEPVTGYTRAQVVKRALEIDPVGIFGVDVCGCSRVSEFVAPLASDTGGDVLESEGNLSAAFAQVFARAGARPVVRANPVYFAKPGQPVTFSAEGSYDPDSTITSYRWDLDGDGTFETQTAGPNAARAYPEAGELLVGVAAVADDGGIGTAISRVVISPRGANAYAPGKARTVRARATGRRTIRVSWKPPRGGAAKPQSYRIVDTRGQLSAVIRASRRSVTFKRLAPGRRYRFYVEASASTGLGPRAASNAVRLRKR